MHLLLNSTTVILYQECTHIHPLLSACFLSHLLKVQERKTKNKMTHATGLTFIPAHLRSNYLNAFLRKKITKINIK